jgi:hypothetical protein
MINFVTVDVYLQYVTIRSSVILETVIKAARV